MQFWDLNTALNNLKFLHGLCTISICALAPRVHRGEVGDGVWSLLKFFEQVMYLVVITCSTSITPAWMTYLDPLMEFTDMNAECGPLISDTERCKWFWNRCPLIAMSKLLLVLSSPTLQEWCVLWCLALGRLDCWKWAINFGCWRRLRFL